MPTAWEEIIKLVPPESAEEFYAKVANLWWEESSYVLHDIICQMSEEYSIYWDDSSALLADYQWYISNAEHSPTLPSDKVRPRTAIRLKRRNPDPYWNDANRQYIYQMLEESSTDTDWSEHTPQPRRKIPIRDRVFSATESEARDYERGRSRESREPRGREVATSSQPPARARSQSARARSQSRVAMRKSHTAMPLDVSTHLIDVIFHGMEYGLASKAEKLFDYWYERITHYADWQKFVMDNSVILANLEIPGTVQFSGDDIIPNLKIPGARDEYARRIRAIVRKLDQAISH